MEKANKYPLLPVAVSYAIGILVAWVIKPSPWPVAVACGILLCTALAFSKVRQTLIPIIAAGLGLANFAFQTAILSPNDLRRILAEKPEIVTLRGRLLESPALRLMEHQDKQTWRSVTRMQTSAIRINGGDWREAFGNVLVSTSGLVSNAYAGNSLEVSGVIKKPVRARADGLFDYRAFLERQQIYYQLTADSPKDWVILHRSGRQPLADRFQNWGRAVLARGLPFEDESLHLEWALTLGWKTALTEEVSEPFIRAATYHIFAVDGLRMAIIFSIFYGIFRILNLPRPVGGAFLIPIIWFYVILTGWPASAIRAAVMLTVVIAGWLLRRPPNMINSLFTAALIILLWQPQQLFQAGFQLSFLVVVCIIVLMPVLQELARRCFRARNDEFRPEAYRRQLPGFMRRPAHFWQEVLLTSLAAWLGSLPLAAYYFNILTPVSTPANLVAVPLCMLVLIGNFTSFLLVGWFPSAAELFNYSGWGCMELIRLTSGWFANWRMAYYYVPAPSFLTSVTYYIWLFALVTGATWPALVKKAKWVGVGVLTLVWAGVCLQQNFGITRLTILPISGGAAVHATGLTHSDDVLINCGSENIATAMTRPFLRAQGVNGLAHFILGEGEIRQIGGAPVIINSFAVPEVWTGQKSYRSAPCKRVLKEIAASSRSQLKTVSPKQPIGPWQVIYPAPEDRFNLANDNGLVLKASLRGARILMVSDLGLDGQKVLLDHGSDLRAEVLITGIPARGEAAGDALLDAVQPALIIVTDCETPYTFRARPQLVERLARRKIPVLYTRNEGAVTIELRNGKWLARTTQGTEIKLARSEL